MELRRGRTALVGSRRVPRPARSRRSPLRLLPRSRRRGRDDDSDRRLGLDRGTERRAGRGDPPDCRRRPALAAGPDRLPRRDGPAAAGRRAAGARRSARVRVPDLQAARRAAQPSRRRGSAGGEAARPPARHGHPRVLQAPPGQAVPVRPGPKRLSGLPDRERRPALLACGVSEELVPLWRQAGLRALYVGDEAVVETGCFSLEGRAIRKVRQSVARLEKCGYSAELAELSAVDERTLCELEAVAERWRAGAAERGFSMAMDSLRTEREAGGVVLFGRDAGGRIRGFIHLVPSYGRPAMSLSSMRRDRETPNGMMEFLVVRAIEALRERGIEEISLNFAAFARVMHGPRGRLERLLGRVVALGNPFFQIESLYRFNAKFFPRWEPRYLLYEGTLGLPRAGLAVMRAEGQLPKPRRRGSAEGES
ncbi:MAG: DUF2156 domain-containing protein [Actinobacteria bacterium]|nr:MAG: DUF2156 domain-containing protein [Actinomycetota bacterium]